MATVIGGEFKIALPGIKTTAVENRKFFSSGRGAFAAILRKIISQNIKVSQKRNMRMTAETFLVGALIVYQK